MVVSDEECLVTLINKSGGLKNGRCYSILRYVSDVNVYTQGLKILASTNTMEALFKVKP